MLLIVAIEIKCMPLLLIGSSCFCDTVFQHIIKPIIVGCSNWVAVVVSALPGNKVCAGNPLSGYW